MAIDYGSRRMGLAVSDPLGITAQGIETLQRKNKRADFGRLERTIREYQVREIVLGNPLRMSGEEGIQSQKVAEFAEELRQQYMLGYTPDKTSESGYHKIELTTKKKDLYIQARDGYYADK